jgi:hypothetical protein
MLLSPEIAVYPDETGRAIRCYYGVKISTASIILSWILATSCYIILHANFIGSITIDGYLPLTKRMNSI